MKTSFAYDIRIRVSLVEPCGAVHHKWLQGECTSQFGMYSDKVHDLSVEYAAFGRRRA